MDIMDLKKKLNLTNDEVDEIIFLESLDDKIEYITCPKCHKRVLKSTADKYNGHCLPCFDFWYC